MALKGNRSGHDLVIGMTLAEIFLLLMLVGWYGSRLESEEGSQQPITPEEELKRELEQARQTLGQRDQQIQELERQIANYRAIINWLEIETHSGPIRSPADLPDVLDSLRRGKPACETPNVLIEATVDNDTVSVFFRRAFQFEDATFANGQSLSESSPIDTFLATLKKYYSLRTNDKKPCVFDFALVWRTDRDYRVGKKKFEGYFYPAGDRQLR